MWEIVKKGWHWVLKEVEPPASNFEKSFAFSAKWEGGSKVTKDKDDPGGTTKYGIAQKYHPDVKVEEITEEQAKNIYRLEYWNAIDGNALNWPLCLVVFDTAVNIGAQRAKTFLQKAEGDWKKYIGIREQFYKDKVKETPKKIKYLKGWLNRCADLRRAASE